MTADTQIKVKQISPVLRYRDPDAAIAWMVDVLGMEKYAIYRDQGRIVHAEMKFGGIFLGLGPTSTEGPFAGPVTNQGVYVAMDGVDALYERAKSKGADIVEHLVDRDYGSRDFILRDLEGYTWSFGTYDHAPEPHLE